MKRISMLLALGTALSVASVTVQAASFTTSLSGANENPVNSSPGVGSSSVSLDTATHQLQVSAVALLHPICQRLYILLLYNCIRWLMP